MKGSRTRRFTLTPLAGALVVGLLSTQASAQSADALYYQIGGASPFSVSAGRGYNPNSRGIGISWNMNATCGNFDIGATVSNQLNGVTDGFQNLMGQVVQNAQGAVASLPAMVIQRANPGLYDLLSNGVLQGRVDFDRASMSCRQMSERMADMVTGQGWQQMAMAESWQSAAQTNADVVAAQEQVDQSGGNQGVTWVGGQRRGGSGQKPIRVVEDTARAGYNLLHGRSDTTSTAPIAGGGGGWGSVATNEGTWIGGGGLAGASGGSGSGGSGSGSGSGSCLGGMCTVWQSPEEAAEWTQTVIGEQSIRTCDGCERSETQAGSGLVRELEREQQEVYGLLLGLVDGSEPLTPENLRQVSAGDGLTVSRGVIESLRSDPEASLLIHRLSGEMALARTLTKALWARRLLLAGSSDPGIADNEQGMSALDRKLVALDRDIESLRSEMEIRQALGNSAAGIALERASRRSQGASQGETFRPDAALDGRGRPAGEEGGDG
ncbi:integrating conjugative element protein [Billgrantia gudaonensis]|uniref:Integrating conjugative element protein, PFL_4711 family n=1 Tax=Billgrantia gudaonensis TaxID=376427 RepID=A0A1G9EFI0_9GAMM|nr:integrating conjugative element protein [Halomonas gudaonensis]SDK74858.1 integrating conjugative element protein, PFL_4711 family [Halomonas gudaonensis]